MKIALQFESPLLLKSLEMQLKNHLSSIKSADIILSDKKIKTKKPVLLISSDYAKANIKKPYTRAQLFLALEDFYKQEKEKNIIKDTIEPKILFNANSTLTLEEKIEKLTKQFTKDIVQAVKGHYAQ